MHKVVKAAVPLAPDVRLAQAISEFESDLHVDQKAEFRSLKSKSIRTPPTTQDVMVFTAHIDRSFAIRNPVVAPRLMKVLETVQQFASLGDILIGGSQNIIACGVWTLVRMTMTIMTTVSSFAEKLSRLFVDIGRSAPRLEEMVLVYHESKNLQATLCEYFTVVVHLCHDVLRFTQKSHLARIGLSLTDSSLDKHRQELTSWGDSIRDQVLTLQGGRQAEEAKLDSRFRNDSASFWQLSSLQQKVQSRQHVLDFCSQYDYAVTWRQIRQMGKTNLFSRCAEYQAWKTNMKGRTLFFVGKLGSGKSVLLANMLDDLNIHLGQNASCPVAFFFCRHDVAESLNPRVIIGSIARQILSQVSNAERAVDLVENVYSHDPFKVMRDILRRVLPSVCRPFAVVDGLDELDSSDRETLLENLKRLQNAFGLSLCISVRKDPANWLQNVSTQFLRSTVVPMPDNKSEIEQFIKETLEKHLESSRIAIGDPALILEIQDALVKGSQGMFLWVALQIEALRTMESDYAIRKALQDLPKDLSETFSRALQRSRKFGPILQERIFNLITVAQCPLSPEEMRLALSIIPGKPIWDESRLPNDIHTGLASCGGLVVLDEDESTLHLVHHSVKQWLISDSSKGAGVITIRVESAHEEMTHKLITYLNYSQFESQLGKQVVPHVKSGQALNTIINTTRNAASGSSKLALSLLRSGGTGGFNFGRSLAEAQKHVPPETISVLHNYARKYWTDHILWCFPLPAKIHTLFENICSREGLANSKRAEMFLGSAVRHPSMDLAHYIINCLDVDVNVRVDDQHRMALHIASSHAFEHVVKRLVDFPGIDVTLRDRSGQTPISAAVGGHLKSASDDTQSKFTSIIKILMGTKQINFENGTLQPVIEELIAHKSETLIPVVLDSIIGIKMRDVLWQNIEKIIRTGDDRVLKLFVEHKATPPLEGKSATRYFPLHVAIAHRCKEKKIDILLGSGKVSAWQLDRSHQTPFHLAAVQGKPKLLNLLLYGRKNLNSIPKYQLTAIPGKDHLAPAVLLTEAPFPISTMSQNEQDIYGDTALHIATRLGRKEVVELILSLPETDVHVGGVNETTPLHIAAKSGHLEIFSMILTHSPQSIKSVDSFENTPLHLAATAGHADIVAFAIQKCSSNTINYKNGEKKTPLHMATIGGHISVMKALVGKEGIDLNAVDTSRRTALHHAALSGKREAVSLLLRNGSEPQMCDRVKRTPFYLAAKEGHISVMKLLISKQGMDLNSIDVTGLAILHHVALSGKCEVVDLLLQQGFDPQIADRKKRTPLYLAAMGGHTAVIEILLTQDCIDLDSKDSSGFTAIHRAALSNKFESVDLLLQKGADPWISSKNGETLLHLAAKGGHIPVMENLITEKGFDLDSTDTSGRAALHHAALSDSHEAVDLLLKKGANPWTRDKEMSTPLHHATAIGNYDTAKSLLESSPELAGAQDAKGRTPLHIAVQKDRFTMAAFLLDTGLMDVNKKDNEGSSAVDIAAQAGYLLMERLIISHEGATKS